MKKKMTFTDAFSREALRFIRGGGRAAYDTCSIMPCNAIGPLSWLSFCKMHTEITGELCVCGGVVPNSMCKLG
ncbi:hypothetical protein KTO58_10525 [Chitinophaga pendula]|uniref:hypothetical protein n=1 Tax=Chitinophaga TaxID=79328 RepID=UPI000BAFE7DE|nr:MULTISPECIES: hypothetical protein [Chitinophaga]ASZ12781.1 hypothetical protein CK934_18375 [Chitinophaga sp. MD30]UCJ09598.1 hypothetical protein KTO58_10525 [Chitinophaga pendula]